MLKQHTNKFLIKLLMGYLLLGLLPFLLLSNALLTLTGNYLQDSIINNITQSTLYMDKNLSALFEDYDHLSKSIYEYRSADGSYLHDILSDHSMQKPELKANINSMLYQILYKSNYIDSVSFFSDSDAYFVSKSVKPMFKESDISQKLEAVSIDDTDSISVFFDRDAKNCLFLVRTYMDTSSITSASTHPMGRLVICVDFQAVKEILEPVLTTHTQEFYLLDKNQQIIYQFGPVSSPNSPPPSWVKHFHPDENQSVKLLKDDYIIYRQIKSPQWLLCTSLPKEAVGIKRFLSNHQLLVIAVISPLFLFASYLLYSKKIMTPVKLITDAMAKIETGDLDTVIECQTKDEFSIIINTLNHMTKNLKSYIEQVYISNLKQKEAELDALKMQIRPHYLYNTLEIIRMTALESDDRIAADMIHHLSRQLRYLTDRREHCVALEQELENARDYFFLVSIRYERKITLDINVPHTLRNISVPKLMLQPLVENAVIHGFPERKEGTISIKAEKNKNMLIIHIMDNGVGIPIEKAEELNSRMNCSDITQFSANTSIGITNVAARIKLNCGTQGSLKLSSIPGIGTIVTVHIPLSE